MSEGVWMVSGVSGWCLDGVWMVSGWCLRVSGMYEYQIPLKNVKEGHETQILPFLPVPYIA